MVQQIDLGKDDYVDLDIQPLAKAQKIPARTLLQRLGTKITGLVKSIHYIGLGLKENDKNFKFNRIPMTLGALGLVIGPWGLILTAQGNNPPNTSVGGAVALGLSLTGFGGVIFHDLITTAYNTGKYTVEMRRSEARNALSRSGSLSI